MVNINVVIFYILYYINLKISKSGLEYQVLNKF